MLHHILHLQQISSWTSYRKNGRSRQTRNIRELPNFEHRFDLFHNVRDKIHCASSSIHYDEALALQSSVRSSNANSQELGCQNTFRSLAMPSSWAHLIVNWAHASGSVASRITPSLSIISGKTAWKALSAALKVRFRARRSHSWYC